MDETDLIFTDSAIKDLARIVDIYNSTIPSRMVTADTERVTVESRINWFKEHNPKNRPLWAIRQKPSEEIIGWVSFQSFYGRPAYNATVEISIYLDPSVRGKGVGSYVLGYSIAKAKSFGVKTLLGFIFAHNEPSLKLFRKMGFEDWAFLPNVALLDGIERGLRILGKRIACVAFPFSQLALHFAMKISGNKILITGGASGIGLGLTERFIKENNTVVICGRRESILKETTAKFPAVITRQCDLSLAEERENLFRWVSQNHPDLNVLVNNAGIQQWMSIDDNNFFERAKEEITTNIEAPIHLTTLFIKLKSLTTVMNVTSGLSFVPLTKTAVYSATKAFFHSFTISLRHLLKEKNIEVIELIPPALNTDLGGKGLHDHAPPVSDFIESIFQQLKQGKTELTFGFSEAMSKAGPEDLKNAFARLNPTTQLPT
jgi:uncharacterized oxidoreductase